MALFKKKFLVTEPLDPNPEQRCQPPTSDSVLSVLAKKNFWRQNFGVEKFVDSEIFYVTSHPRDIKTHPGDEWYVTSHPGYMRSHDVTSPRPRTRFLSVWGKFFFSRSAGGRLGFFFFLLLFKLGVCIYVLICDASFICYVSHHMS